MNQLKMYKLSNKNFKNSLNLYSRGISLPSYPNLKLEEIKYISNSIKKIIKLWIVNIYQKWFKKINFKDLGQNVMISKNVTLIGASNISLGSNVRIDDYCIISSNEGHLKMVVMYILEVKVILAVLEVCQ